MNENYLIEQLKKVSDYDDTRLFPCDRIRAMMNRALPYDLSDEFYKRQDEYLSCSRGEIFNVETLIYKSGMAIYRGDITLLKADAIVNAGNSALLGCFMPLHKCIDNCIHSFAGLQVRRDLMRELNGREVANGEVHITRGYNLPCKYIFHTVGPIYDGSEQNEIDITACYQNCLQKADEMGLKTLVFCSLSTGVFGYPIEQACHIAVSTVKEYLKNSTLNVVFDVFSEGDEKVYERELAKIK